MFNYYYKEMDLVPLTQPQKLVMIERIDQTMLRGPSMVHFFI